MLCKVYFANQKGRPRPKDEVRRSVQIGALSVRLMSRYAAVLSSPDTGRYLLPALDAVTVEIKPRGVLLTGTEMIPRRQTMKTAYDMYAQVWWCVPVFEGVVLDDLSAGG